MANLKRKVKEVAKGSVFFPSTFAHYLESELGYEFLNGSKRQMMSIYRKGAILLEVEFFTIKGLLHVNQHNKGQPPEWSEIFRATIPISLEGFQYLLLAYKIINPKNSE